MLAREYCDDIKKKNKPIVLSHRYCVCECKCIYALCQQDLCPLEIEKVFSRCANCVSTIVLLDFKIYRSYYSSSPACITLK